MSGEKAWAVRRAPPARRVFETRVLTLQRPQRHAVERVDVDLDLRVVVVADVGHVLLDDLDDAVEVRRVEPGGRGSGVRRCERGTRLRHDSCKRKDVC